MKKLSILMSVIAVLIGASSVTSAQQCGCYDSTFGAQYRARYDANVQWPRIYIPPARSSVCQTYNAMITNGWRRQNLLGNYHFSEDTNELTDAGKLKVNWILSQAPMHRRNVFVQRASEEVATAARIAAVHGYAGNMSPAIGNVDVNDTHIVAEGHAASSVDNVFVGYETNRLPPVLPAPSGGGGGGDSQ